MNEDPLPEQDCPKTIEEEFGEPRNRLRRTNTWGMSEKQLAIRDVQVKQLKDYYPSLTESIIEAIWSLVETTPEEEMQKIIDEKLWEGPAKARDAPGTYVGKISVESRSEGSSSSSSAVESAA